MLRYLIAPLLLAGLLSQVSAAPTDAKPLFVCTLRADDVAALRIETVQSGVTAEIDEPSEPGITVAAPPQPPFVVSHTTGPRGYSLVARFTDPNTQYELHYIDRPREMGASTDYSSIQAWLVITPTTGEIREYDCDEIAIDIPRILASMPCDLTNRYGQAACNPLFPARRESSDPQFDGY